MPEYTAEMRDEGGAEHTVTLRADDDADAEEVCIEEVVGWVMGGEWGDDGALVEVWYWLKDEEDEVISSGPVRVKVGPDHEALMRRAGAPDDCDHDFVSTVEVDGGLDDNAGVWNTGGTSFLFSSHCSRCGLRKHEHRPGSQRDPGERDTVRYEMPDTEDDTCTS